MAQQKIEMNNFFLAAIALVALVAIVSLVILVLNAGTASYGVPAPVVESASAVNAAGDANSIYDLRYQTQPPSNNPFNQDIGLRGFGSRCSNVIKCQSGLVCDFSAVPHLSNVGECVYPEG